MTTPQTDAINGKIDRLLVSEYDKTNSPMYPHLASTDTVKNCGFSKLENGFVWQHKSIGVCVIANSNTAAERKLQKRVVMTSVNGTVEVDADFSATSDMIAREWNNLPEIAY